MNLAVKLYSEELESPLMDRDLLQVDICHGARSWYGSQRGGKR